MEIREEMSVSDIGAAIIAGCTVYEYMAGGNKRWMILYPLVCEEEGEFKAI